MHIFPKKIKNVNFGNCRISCPKAPEWYAALYFEHLRNVENLTEEAVYAWARRKSRETNINIVVPPPHRGSPRFLQVAYLLDFTIGKLLTFTFPIYKSIQSCSDNP